MAIQLCLRVKILNDGSNYQRNSHNMKTIFPKQVPKGVPPLNPYPGTKVDLELHLLHRRIEHQNPWRNPSYHAGGSLNTGCVDRIHRAYICNRSCHGHATLELGDGDGRQIKVQKEVGWFGGANGGWIRQIANGSVVVAHWAKEKDIIWGLNVVYKTGKYGFVWINMTTSIVKGVSLLVRISLSYYMLPIFILQRRCGKKQLEILEYEFEHYNLVWKHTLQFEFWKYFD